jgi:hypothetical protein
MYALTLAIFLAASFLPQSGGPIRDFTDTDLTRVIAQESRVLFYSFSAGMPLSLEGLSEVRSAAADLRATVVLLADPSASEAEIRNLVRPVEILANVRFQKSRRLRDAGIQLHYPSVIVAQNGRVVGKPIAGFKSRTGYVALVSDLLKLPWKETFQVSNSVDYKSFGASYFFKPLYGTDFLLNGWNRELFDLKTKETFDAGQRGDPGTSVDGEFITVLDPGGLTWFAVSSVLARTSKPLYRDPGLRTYQSMGLLPASSTHRVLGAVSSSSRPTGLIFRDYESRREPVSGQTIVPVTEWTLVCDGTSISIPMMSKTGLYVSGMHQETLRVFQIGKDGKQCAQTFDSGAVTGKADFSADDRFLVFVSRSEGADAVFLADLKTRQVKPIYSASSGSQLVFPNFMTEDRIVVYDATVSKFLILDRTRLID